jgi:hypothetical protein
MVDWVSRKNDTRIVRKVIDDGGGEIINCVDKRLQHGFDAPIETFAEPPPDPPNAEQLRKMPNPQLYGTVGERCPEGTVPQLRVELAEVESFGSLDRYLGRAQPMHVGPTSLHQYATRSVYLDPVNHSTAGKGAYSTMNIYTPFVENTAEGSISQIWVSRGSYDPVPNSLQTVETGYMVAPQYAPNNNPFMNHLFISTTWQNYQVVNGALTFCVNLDCGSRWVSTSSGWVPGATLQASWNSQLNNPSQQMEFTFSAVWGTGGNWWINWQGTWIGYFVASNYNSRGILNGADLHSYGGEIWNLDGTHPGRHTHTDMGAGTLPPPDSNQEANYAWASGYTKAAYHRNLKYVDSAGAYQLLTRGETSVSDAQCYNIRHNLAQGFFFFGGGGWDPVNCQ